jgi:hypothetical protein
MNEEPKSIWKKSWKGWSAVLIWSLLIALAISLALLISALANLNAPLSDFFGPIACVGIIGIFGCFVVVYLVMPFLRWIFWKHWRRALFSLVCLATLVALFYAEEDWRGWHAWQKYKHEWEAKGEKFDFADFVPLPVPNDQNFALAPIVFTSYGQVLTRDGKAIPPDKRDTNFINRLKIEIVHNYEDSPKDGNWQIAKTSDLKTWRNYYRALAATTNEFPVALQPQSPAADVLLALSKYDPAIEELRQASQLPYSRFPLDYDIEDPAEILLPHLYALKQCSLALQLRAIAELENGQSEKAFDDVKLALRLADSVHTEPCIITHLVRIAILQITLQPVWEGLAEHKWSDAQLVELDSELAKLDFPANYEFSVRSERAAHGKIIDWLEQKRNRFWLLFKMVGSDEQNTMNNFGVVARIYFFAPKGWFYQNKITIAQVEQQWNLPLVDATSQIVSPKMAQHEKATLESWLRKTPFNFFARLLEAGFGGFAQRTAYGQNAANLARVAIALERYHLAYGEYPQSLDALAPQFITKLPHDIINGQPLNYRRTADGRFVLYSVGWNEKDDDGEVGLKEDGSVDINTGDWVWRYSAK